MKAYNIRKIRLKETDSTNHYVATLPVPGNEDMVIVIAENQTAGKGQGGTFWESEKGKNLTFSIMCAPQFFETEDAVCHLAGPVACALRRCKRHC